MIDLNYIAEHIVEFEEYINSRTMDKIIKELDLTETIYSIKYMVKLGSGGQFDTFVFLIYKHNLLVGVLTHKDKKIVSQELNMDGIDIDKYLPKNQSFKDDNCPSIQKIKQKGNLFDIMNVEYDNKYTTAEKLDILSDYINNNVNPLKDKGYKWMLRKNMKK